MNNAPDLEVAPIQTERLLLVSMATGFLRAISDNDIDTAQASVAFAVSNPCSLANKIWVRRRLEMIREDPAQHPWMYRAIVRRSDNQMLGHISFHHKAPDPDLLEYSERAAELGYTIEPEYRRHGYARESAISMMEWAGREHGVLDFILTISPENVPSLEMARSMGFEIVGERVDEIDGPEYVLKAALERVLRTKSARSV